MRSLFLTLNRSTANVGWTALDRTALNMAEADRSTDGLSGQRWTFRSEAHKARSIGNRVGECAWKKNLRNRTWKTETPTIRLSGVPLTVVPQQPLAKRNGCSQWEWLQKADNKLLQRFPGCVHALDVTFCCEMLHCRLCRSDPAWVCCSASDRPIFNSRRTSLRKHPKRLHTRWR